MCVLTCHHCFIHHVYEMYYVFEVENNNKWLRHAIANDEGRAAK